MFDGKGNAASWIGGALGPAGGTGRRNGVGCRGSQGREGSSPSAGTYYVKTVSGSLTPRSATGKTRRSAGRCPNGMAVPGAVQVRILAEGPLEGQRLND